MHLVIRRHLDTRLFTLHIFDDAHQTLVRALDDHHELVDQPAFIWHHLRRRHQRRTASRQLILQHGVELGQVVVAGCGFGSDGNDGRVTSDKDAIVV